MQKLSCLASIAAMLGSAPATAQDNAPPASSDAAPPACSSPDDRAFDFWVGEWDVFRTGDDRLVATSSIEAMFAGCAIRETWKPLGGSGGGSFSHFDAKKRQWRQLWLDSSGARVEFAGGMADGRMILTGLWPDLNGKNGDALVRMTYSIEPDGSVRQHGEQSTDHGLSWSSSFDFLYKPREKRDD